MWIFRDRLRPHQQRSKVFEFIVQPRTAGASPDEVKFAKA